LNAFIAVSPTTGAPPRPPLADAHTPQRAGGFICEHAEHGLQARRLRRDPGFGFRRVRRRAINAVETEAAEVERAVLRRGQALRENPAVGECDFGAIGGLQHTGETDDHPERREFEPAGHFAPLYMTRQILPFWLSPM
jgi:hypothetical protein